MKNTLFLFLFSFVLFSANSQDNLENETIEFQESLGILRLGALLTDVSKELGKPEIKTKSILWEADGQKHQTWTYSKQGIVLDVVVEKNPRLSWVNMITIISPCTFKTKRNIGIGSTKREVENQYKELITEENSGEEQIILGSIYGGIIFTFKNGIVDSIFFGALAE